MNSNKSFETKQKSHVNPHTPKVHEESFENREKISTHRDWSWTPETDQKSFKKKTDQQNNTMNMILLMHIGPKKLINPNQKISNR
jgi:hypothetical protein